MLEGTGRSLRFFGMQMPDDIYCSAWSGGVKRIWCLRANCSHTTWRYCVGQTLDLLKKDKRLLVFIDNDGLRYSWIKGAADSQHAHSMIRQGTLRETNLNVTLYFCRVATSSNLGDGPSRMDFGLRLKLGATRTFVSHEDLRRLGLVIYLASQVMNDHLGCGWHLKITPS